ncbi:hypothetical protein IT774_00095 [Salinimonas marina]|uniref:Uncharacterized protein n=1 Tax=Salinimonas marina TaxID=2785918 RepID=A0A7S9HD23_9ALTE|nr:hypothetical protein [Salinimonas marina]QPG05735.1 hypothetical protein IT774_00095 [Salinimonas marina]
MTCSDDILSLGLAKPHIDNFLGNKIMLQRSDFESERVQFLEDFCNNITSMMGIEASNAFDVRKFNAFTDIAFELANFGTMDSFLSFNNSDLVEFIETMERMLPTVAYNMNIEQEYRTLITAVNCMALYLSLYIVEDEYVATYCDITNEAIAAVLGVKVSTLKNIVSLKVLAAMNNDELRHFLESQERFKPFKPYDSSILDGPLELSRVTTSNALIYALEQRARKYEFMDVLNELYQDHGIRSESGSNIKFTVLFSLSGTSAQKLGNLLGKLNIEFNSLKTAVSNVSANIMAATGNSSVLLNYKEIPAHADQKESAKEYYANQYIFQRPDVPYTSDNLGEYLKVEYGFKTHPDDKGKNKKLFAVKKGNVSLAIERTKTPSVWIPHHLACELDPSHFEITWYKASKDGRGRHSGLHSYSDFHKVAIGKVKVKSFDCADLLISQLYDSPSK